MPDPIGSQRLDVLSSDSAENQTNGETALLGAVTKGSAAVATKLRRAILGGAYAYGDRLPPERELATAFAASRTTVRTALRQLEEEQMIARRVGSGTFVVHGSRHEDKDIAQVTSPLELIDVRLGVEPRIVRLAVMHATARDLDRLSEALDEADRSGTDTDHFTRWDQTFHLGLALATRNPLMVWVYRQINHVRGHSQWRAMKDKILTPQRIAEYNAEHRAIFDAIVARDADLAVDLLTRHLGEAHRDLVGAHSG